MLAAGPAAAGMAAQRPRAEGAGRQCSCPAQHNVFVFYLCTSSTHSCHQHHGLAVEGGPAAAQRGVQAACRERPQQSHPTRTGRQLSRSPTAAHCRPPQRSPPQGWRHRRRAARRSAQVSPRQRVGRRAGVMPGTAVGCRFRVPRRGGRRGCGWVLQLASPGAQAARRWAAGNGVHAPSSVLGKQLPCPELPCMPLMPSRVTPPGCVDRRRCPAVCAAHPHVHFTHSTEAVGARGRHALR